MVDAPSTEIVDLDNLHSLPQQEETDPVGKIGHTATIPQTLDGLIGLIGVNSSVVCPWPNFYFVAALNLGNGGTLGLLVGTIVACFGMAPVYLSLAEKMRKSVPPQVLALKLQADLESTDIRPPVVRQMNW